MIHSTTTRAGWTALLAAALFNRKAAALVATGSLLAMGLLPSQADSYTYTGPGSILAPTTGNFSNGFTDTTTNTAGVPPASNALTTLTFGGSGSTAYTATDNISGALLLNLLTLNSSATVSETIASAAGSSLNFGGASNTITQSGSGNFAISATLSSTGQLTFNGSGGGITTVSGANSGINAAGVLVTGGTVKVAGNNAALGGASDLLTITGGTVDLGGLAAGGGLRVSGLAGTGGTLTSTVVGAANVLNIFGGTGGTYSGSITGNLAINLSASAAAGFDTYKNEIETLSGNNTYTGGTKVNVGTLTVGSATGLGATTGTLNVSNSNAAGAGNAVTLNLSTTAPTTTGSLSGTVATTTGAGTNSATINNGGQLFTVNQTLANTYAGVIAGTGGFTLGSLSTAALTLTGGNTFTGDININAATLKAGSTYTGSSAATDLGNVTVARNINVNNGGTLTFGATNVLGDSSSSAPAATLTVAAGGLVNSVSGQFNMLGPVKLTGGTITSTAGYTGIYDSFLFRGNVTTSGAATSTLSTSGGANSQFQLQGGSGNAITFNVGSTGQAAGTPDLLVSGILADGFAPGVTGTISASGFIKAGTGLMTLTGANTYTGGTTVAAGTLAQGAANAIGATTSDALSVTGGTFDLAGFPLLTTSLSGTGGSIVNSSGTFVTLTNTGTTSTTLASVLGGTGGNNFGLTMNGTGILTLSGVNTYSGGTIINAGTLAAGEPGAGGTVTSLGSGSVTINTGGQLTLNGTGGALVNENVTNAVVLNGGTLLANDGYQHLQGAVSVTGAGSKLITIYPGKDISVDGVLSGSGALTVNNNIYYQYAGEGITHFTNAANTYTGTITSGVSSGIAAGNTSGGLISVDAANALQFASVVNNSGSSTVFPGGNSGNTGTFQNLAGIQFGPSVTAAAFGSLAGTGNFALVNTNTTPAAVVLTAGSNNASTAYSGIISGTGSLTKTGTGTLTLSGADTYSGATTITAGNLQVGSGGATPTGSIASSSSIAVGGGATLITASNGALNNSATAINLGDGNGSATVQNAAFTGATAANNIQKAGALSLGLGTANILDFAGNFGTFDFGSGAAADPGGNGFGLFGTSLNVRNFGAALNESTLGGNYQLLFDNALTTAQLADISFLNSDSSQFGAIQQFVSGTSGQVQILEGTSPAPEPAQTAALGLFGLGLGALVLKARKRSSVAVS